MFQALFQPLIDADPTTRLQYLAQQLREKRAKLIELEVDLELSYAMGDEAFEATMADKPLEERRTWGQLIDCYHMLIAGHGRMIQRLERMLEDEPAAEPELAGPAFALSAQRENVVDAARALVEFFEDGEFPLPKLGLDLQEALAEYDALVDETDHAA